jgi:plasmid stabilization system protein ParE
VTYRVEITEEVLAAIDEQIVHLAAHGAPHSRLESWYDGLVALIHSLETNARRYPVAEAVTAAAGYEVRRANYGEYAIFYRIRSRPKAVVVIAFRHGRRRPWPGEDPS